MYTQSLLLPLTAILGLHALFTGASDLESRNNQCATGYSVCAPAGASSRSVPEIGDQDFQNLYVDLVDSSLPTFKKRDPNASPEPQSSGVSTLLCCVESLSCVLMANLMIPFCYDKFTTNFALSDGSFGTIYNGSYTSSSGDKANLITGEYTLASGGTGDIYSNVAAPNTATLVLPSQYQGTGVGSAIPAGALGMQVTVTLTTTIQGTTIQPVTIPASTIPGSEITSFVVVPSLTTATVQNSVVVNTVSVSSSFETRAPGSTIEGSTIPGTTILAHVTTIVTTEAASSTSATSTSRSTAANRGRAPTLLLFIMITLLVTMLSYIF